MTGTLHEDQRTFLIRSLSFLLGMRIVLAKIVTKIQAHILMFSNIYFSKIVPFMT
jgi:hypothetical protein